MSLSALQPMPSRSDLNDEEAEAAALKRWLALVKVGSHADVQAALRDGWAPVNATDSAGFTALMRSCVSGKLLELLLSSPRCDVNAGASTDQTTALLLASRHRSARIVHTLLRRNALLSRDTSGSTALHKAAANSDTAVLKLLLQARAQPYARDNQGRCALGAALLHGNGSAALVLLAERKERRSLLQLGASATDGGVEEEEGATLESLPEETLDLIVSLASDRRVAKV